MTVVRLLPCEYVGYDRRGKYQPPNCGHVSIGFAVYSSRRPEALTEDKDERKTESTPTAL